MIQNEDFEKIKNQIKEQLKRKGYVNIILQELKKYTNNDVFVELKSERIPRF